ncbi:IS3 family transposase [Actinophytocola algeriensis]|uniref:IS3 family transposase n=1 Tax=Actinophytocola algeriensis TaxID=1768010 RepID=UPI001CEF1DB4
MAARIRVIHRDSAGTCGVPRVTAQLREAGHLVNHKRVARMRGIVCPGCGCTVGTVGTAPRSAIQLRQRSPICSGGISGSSAGRPGEKVWSRLLRSSSPWLSRTSGEGRIHPVGATPVREVRRDEGSSWVAGRGSASVLIWDSCW